MQSNLTISTITLDLAIPSNLFTYKLIWISNLYGTFSKSHLSLNIITIQQRRVIYHLFLVLHQTNAWLIMRTYSSCLREYNEKKFPHGSGKGYLFDTYMKGQMLFRVKKAV